MEFPFDVGNVLPGRITLIETVNNESDIKIYHLCLPNEEKSKIQNTNGTWFYHLSANIPWDIKLKKKKEELESIIDEMGHASAQAQCLRVPITTLKKFLNSKKQKIYFIRDDNNNKSVIGFLKIGTKRLFICDDVGAHHELDPLCILDFYVHESKQRSGFGHQLFNSMLQNENILPDKLAIDRPSYKFLSFLNKHYGLKNPVSQSNNFVIFPGFFINREVTRPPIFLYGGNAMQPVKSNNSQKQNAPTSSYMNNAESLNAIKVPLSSDGLKKNKYYSAAARCLVWDDGENMISHHKQHQHPKLSAHSNLNNSDNTRNTNRSVCSPMERCSDVHKKFDGWSSTHSTPCSLTPVDSVPNYSQRKWNQLQSSWNIFGVKPIDYSFYHKQSDLH